MRLTHKLVLCVWSGVLVVGLALVVLQQLVSARVIENFARDCSGEQETAHWGWVERLENATDAALTGAMAEGDMDRFSNLLTAQRSVAGLQEMSLHDHKGKVAYSSLPERLGKELPPEIKENLLANHEPVKRRTADSFEIYKPLRAEKSCTQCHTDWQENMVCGVVAMRYSDDELEKAQANWGGFESRFKRTGLYTGSSTVGLLLLATGLIMSVSVSRLVSSPLSKASGTMLEQAEQVATAAAAVGESSQALAAQSTQQAASLEETSASLEELSAVTKQNAQNSSQVKELAGQACAAAENGAAHMKEMSVQMDRIKAASEEIRGILKVIDQIAFQTNLLALNAAVEAARAGEAGLGFAVVADEVRTLAKRSADAAKETSEKAAKAFQNTAEGVQLSVKVAAVLDEIVLRCRKVDQLAEATATAAAEQSQGIAQINFAVSQMDQGTQNSAAQAEAGATAAEQLNGQAAAMRQAVAAVLTLIDSRHTLGATAAADVANDVRQMLGGGKTEKSKRSERDSLVQAKPALPGQAFSPPDDLVVWEPERMSTGHEEIDEQHRQLFDMINRLHATCKRGASSDEVRQMLKFLAAYVESHFNHEENVMEAKRCPARELNKSAHASFLTALRKIAADFQASENPATIAAPLEKMVADWLTNHICAVDVKLKSCPGSCASRARPNSASDSFDALEVPASSAR